MKSTPTISTPLQEISRLRILPTTLLGQRRNSLTKRKRMVSRCWLPSQVTLFTPWNKEYGRLPPVPLNGDPIPQANNPKLLCVTLDPTYTFSAHASAVARKAGSRLGVLRALSDTAQILLRYCSDTSQIPFKLTYKALIRPFFDYAARVIYPLYSQSSIRRLQMV